MSAYKSTRKPVRPKSDDDSVRSGQRPAGLALRAGGGGRAMNQEQKVKRYCIYESCSSPKRALPPIGDARQNGKAHKDWNSRKMHKKCFYAFQKNKTACRA